MVAGQSPAAALLAGAAGGLAAFFLPHVWISMKATKRQDEIRREMPDMLDMLLISVEAALASMPRWRSSFDAHPALSARSSGVCCVTNRPDSRVGRRCVVCRSATTCPNSTVSSWRSSKPMCSA